MSRSAPTETEGDGSLRRAGAFVALHPSQTGDSLSAVLLTGGDVVLAVVLVAGFGATTLTRRARAATAVAADD